MGRIIIIHYHLNPGGVTRIIESQVLALKELETEYEILVITGHCANLKFYEEAGVELIVNAKLNYLAKDLDYLAELSSIRNLFKDLIDPEDILHVHNLNLGKNPILTLAISEFARRGQSVINHAHDFAEDRPENWEFLQQVFTKLSDENISEILYPPLSGFFHASLSTTDFKRLSEYGVPDERNYLLPNPVVFSTSLPAANPVSVKAAICSALKVSTDKKLITYPVRVIRRKNIGEYILLCWLFSDQANWVVTQPPMNPVEIESYELWKYFCEEENIPLVFEAGTKVDFVELIYASDFCFTTSIKEGFGMVYMEPWLMGTPVLGRNLSNITEDLEQSGIIFPLLYNSINIPGEAVKSDFAALSMQEQMEFIRELKNKPEMRKELLDYNSFLQNLLNSINDSIIESNKTTILNEFSLINYAKRLERIYKRIAR